MLIVAPKADSHFKLERHKKYIHVRQKPKSKVISFMRELGCHNWPEVFSGDGSDDITSSFHSTMTSILDKHMPVQIVKMSSLDKKWFNPSLKLMYIEMQKEYF